MYSITGVGMATSLGGVVHGSAAQRAGISRPCEIDLMEIPDSADGGGWLQGHRVHPYSEGFHQVGLWVRMTAHVLGELIRLGKLPGPEDFAFWSELLFIGAVPCMEWERFLCDEEVVVPELSKHFVESAASLLDLPVNPERVRLAASGHAAVAEAFEAVQLLNARRALIISVDSWIDPASLAWLAQQQRLKTGDHPVGLSPGEGAACLLIETAEDCRDRGGSCLATLNAATFSRGGESAGPGEIGLRLASTIQSICQHSEALPLPIDVYLDLNGENWRASTWANAMLQLHGVLDFDRSRWVFPAAEMGDTGAASGGIAVCLGVRSFARDYAKSNVSLVCSISDRGDTGAILIGRPQAT